MTSFDPTTLALAALPLSELRFREIARRAPGKANAELRRAAMGLRRIARGPNKLARRLRRKTALGRSGSF